MGEETGRFGIALVDALVDMPATAPGAVDELFYVAARLMANPIEDTGARHKWLHATAGYHVPLRSARDRQDILKAIWAGRTAAMAGLMTVIGRTFFEEGGKNVQEWDLVTLKGEWMRETPLALVGPVRVLPQVARSCDLADADQDPNTPCVVIDCTYRFERKP